MRGDDMNFSEKLQTLRKQKGMSQENLAEVMRVSRQAVSKWESGQSYPEIDKLVLLSGLFGVSIDSIVKDDIKNENNHNTYNHFENLKSMLHFEFKSKKKLFDIPLVHINIGFGIHVAKGIIAIGNIAVGFLSIGLISFGLLCLGALALGFVGIAGMALGLLFSIGGIAIGTIAIGGFALGGFALGGFALGVFAIGGLSIGMFSLGGCAIASRIAIGGYASGHIAIGDTVKGAKTIVVQNHNFNSIKAEQVQTLIKQEYPHLWNPIIYWITSIFN
jgi:transcriptional regulator with XRE-family HTH domain